MTMPRRGLNPGESPAWSLLMGACSMLAGLGIMALLVPHRDPWAMSAVSLRVIDGAPRFRITLPFAGPVTASPAACVLGVLLLAALAALSLPREALARAWTSLRMNRSALGNGIAALALLSLSLVPAGLGGRPGSSVVFYLVIGTLSLALMANGFLIFLRHLRPGDGMAIAAGRLYEVARGWFLESRPLSFVGALVLFEFVVTNILSYTLFRHVPHIPDSTAQLFHGMIFAGGRITAPAPKLPDFFAFKHLIIDGGKWYSQYPPGHSLLLGMGVMLGAPWLVNPLLGSLTVAAVYLLGKELHGEVVGRLSALLAVLSPFVLFMSSEYMNHASALLMFTLFAFWFARAMERGGFSNGALAGGAMGCLALIRPYSAAWLCLPFLAYGLVRFLKQPRRLLGSLAGFLALTSIFAGLFLAFNSATTGNPFLLGYEKLYGPGHNPGFGHGGWLGRPHTPLAGLFQTVSNLNGLNKYLFELPLPSLLLIVPVFISGRANRWDRLCILAFLSLAAGYSFYWYQDWCFGPRFLYEAAGLLIILAARGLYELPALWNGVLSFPASRSRIRAASFLTMAFLFGMGFAVNIPPHLAFYGDRYWGVDGEVLAAVRRNGISKAVVFAPSGYGNVFPGNTPLLDQGVIFARDRGPGNQALLELYPGYACYLAAGTDITPCAGAQSP